MQSENQQIDLILSKITLSPPKKAFDFFVEGKDVQSKNKLSKQEIETYTTEYDCLSDTEKDSFLTKEKQDQERYNKEIELLKMENNRLKILEQTNKELEAKLKEKDDN